MRNLLLTFTLLLKLSNITAQIEGAKLKISPLVGDFYIYTTYNTYEGNSTPANGMYFITNNGVVLFDTPWDTTQFQPLLDSIQAKHQKAVIACIATHWHSDRTEGLEYYKQKGIKTYTTILTDELSKRNNKKRAAFLILNDTTFNFSEYTFETFYPGKGHTEDNIVLWFDKQKILYGGCLIKGAEATNLGYLGDGDVLAYYSTLKNVAKKYPNPEYIIVSHHDWNSKKSLQHSIKMAKKLKRRNKK
jgi:metallo-beta-lactamase class B